MEYNTYEIDGQRYIAESGALYRIVGDPLPFDELEMGAVYLYDDSLVKFNDDHGIVNAYSLKHNTRSYPDEDNIEAEPVERVLPEGIEACPECGGWLGPENDLLLRCENCGYDPQENANNSE